MGGGGNGSMGREQRVQWKAWDRRELWSPVMASRWGWRADGASEGCRPPLPKSSRWLWGEAGRVPCHVSLYFFLSWWACPPNSLPRAQCPLSLHEPPTSDPPGGHNRLGGCSMAELALISIPSWLLGCKQPSSQGALGQHSEPWCPAPKCQLLSPSVDPQVLELALLG